MNTKALHKSLLFILRYINRQSSSFSTTTSTLAVSPEYYQIAAVPGASTQTNPSRTDQPKLYKHSQKSIKIPSKSKDRDLSEFISSNKNEPDTFGTLSDNWKIQKQLDEMPDEEDDIIEKEFLFNKEGKTRLTANKYGKIIKQFLSQKKIGHAIEVLETRILKEDRAPPDPYIYNLIITACGEVGYTWKAFKLYNDMKKRRLKVTGHTYTGLFNACANSPEAEDGRKRALHLRAILQQRAVLLNQTIYHAMIKAFGRCGDLETAFMLVDEMLEKRIHISTNTFNFLLQACITDKESGFRHALLVWRKMLDKRMRPSLFTFNLLLRCSRDCGLGDEAAMMQVIQVLLHSAQRKKDAQMMVNSPTENGPAALTTIAGQVAKTSSGESELRPNLICQQPTMGSVVAVNNISSPEHRLMLMGGSKGVLDLMAHCKAKPDIKTFTQLLDQIPSTLADEQELLNAMREAKVSLDVDFCNMMIRKRCYRGDYTSAKDVLKILQEHRLRPDIVTFGVLAMTCQSLSDAKQLLFDINSVGYRPNVEILGALLKNACFTRDCDFVMEIMRILQEEGLKPSQKFLDHLDNFFRFSNKALSNQLTDDTGKLKLDRYQEYRQYYQVWRREMSPETLPHHFHQFRDIHLEPEDLELMNYGKVKYAK